MSVLTWLSDIEPEACEDLLESATFGRIAVLVEGGPEIFPVSHVYDRATRCVLFPTNPRTKLHGALEGPSVAFEVDGIEPGGGSGWSVLVVGHAELVRDPDVIARAQQNRHVLWRSDEDSRWLRIVPSKITGRRISGQVY